MVNKFQKNLIAIAIVVAGILIAGAIIYVKEVKINKPLKEISSKERVLSLAEVGEKAIKYLNKNVLKEENAATLTEINEENGLYKLTIGVGGQNFISYATADGKLLFTQFLNLGEGTPGQEVSQEIPKTERPDVKLFVMSYCPYGLQAQKMFLPVYELLKNKAEMGVYFVNYIMHAKKEIDENLRQYCIQKEDDTLPPPEEKYFNYLSCFVKDGDFEKCLGETNIDRGKLSSCISETDAKYNITKQYNDKSTWLNGNFPRFDVHTDLNEKSEVQGSPTVVINDKVVEVGPRSPEKFKETICQAFNSPPTECSQTLSNDSPTSGFGTGTGSGGGGGCGQ